MHEVVDAMKCVSGTDFKVVLGPRRAGDPPGLSSRRRIDWRDTRFMGALVIVGLGPREQAETQSSKAKSVEAMEYWISEPEGGGYTPPPPERAA